MVCVCHLSSGVMPNEPPRDTLKINGHFIFIHLKYKTLKRIFWLTHSYFCCQLIKTCLIWLVWTRSTGLLKKDSIGNKVKHMHTLKQYFYITDLMTESTMLLSSSAHCLNLYSHAVPLTSACVIWCWLLWREYRMRYFLIKIHEKETWRTFPSWHWFSVSQVLCHWAQIY